MSNSNFDTASVKTPASDGGASEPPAPRINCRLNPRCDGGCGCGCAAAPRGASAAAQAAASRSAGRRRAGGAAAAIAGDNVGTPGARQMVEQSRRGEAPSWYTKGMDGPWVGAGEQQLLLIGGSRQAAAAAATATASTAARGHAAVFVKGWCLTCLGRDLCIYSICSASNGGGWGSNSFALNREMGRWVRRWLQWLGDRRSGRLSSRIHRAAVQRRVCTVYIQLNVRLGRVRCRAGLPHRPLRAPISRLHRSAVVGAPSLSLDFAAGSAIRQGAPPPPLQRKRTLSDVTHTVSLFFATMPARGPRRTVKMRRERSAQPEKQRALVHRPPAGARARARARPTRAPARGTAGRTTCPWAAA